MLSSIAVSPTTSLHVSFTTNTIHQHTDTHTHSRHTNTENSALGRRDDWIASRHSPRRDAHLLAIASPSLFLAPRRNFSCWTLYITQVCDPYCLLPRRPSLSFPLITQGTALSATDNRQFNRPSGQSCLSIHDWS